MTLLLASEGKLLSISPKNQSGFTLIEVLVAVVILSIGVLGAVGMQAAAMQSNKEVRYQAIAGTLARELAEKMRGNHAVGVKTSAAENPYLLDATFASGDTVSAPATNCFTNACLTGLQIAAWDIYEWQLRLIDALPSPRVRICMDSEPFTATGAPKWACTDTGDIAMLKLSWNRANAQGATEFTSNAATPPLIVLPLTAGSPE